MLTKLALATTLLGVVVPGALAVCQPYAQCGGQGFTGDTVCPTGYACSGNQYYKQCIPGGGPTTTTTTTSRTTAKTTSTSTTSAPAAQGTPGNTTRYWDCCKPSCSWPGKGSPTAARTCAKDGVTFMGSNEKNACDGGNSYTCNDYQPWAINDNLSYGFAAANIAGLTEADWCCGCYELTFTSGPVAGKTHIVQVLNTGSDLGAGHFDLQIPGGGVGLFNGCSAQWGAGPSGWGGQYGGINGASECSMLPTQLQKGCQWRFNWFKNADNPYMTFRKVTCPSELSSKSGCSR